MTVVGTRFGDKGPRDAKKKATSIASRPSSFAKCPGASVERVVGACDPLAGEGVAGFACESLEKIQGSPRATTVL